MTRFGECESCANAGNRYCIGCEKILISAGTYVRTGWTAKSGITITQTSKTFPLTEDSSYEH